MEHRIDASINLKDNFTPTIKRVDETLAKHKQSIRYFKKQLKGVGRAYSQMTKSMATAMAPVAGALYKTISQYKETAKEMQKINALTLQLEAPEKERLQKELEDLANELGVTYAQAFNTSAQILTSVEYTGVEDHIAQTRNAINFARAGFTSFESAADLISTLQNSYKLAGTQIDNMANQLIKTQSLGKVTMNGLAASIGQVAATASGAGLEVDELLSLFIALSKNGINEANSSTMINALASEMSRVSATFKNGMQELGIDVESESWQALSRFQQLEEIAKAANGNQQVIQKLFTSDLSKRAVANLIEKDGSIKGLKGYREELQNSGDVIGETTKAIENSFTRMEKAINRLQNAMIELAPYLDPFINKLANEIEYFTKLFNGLDDSTKETIVKTSANLVLFTSALAGVGTVFSVYAGAFSGIYKFIESVIFICKTKFAITIFDYIIGGLLKLISVFKVINAFSFGKAFASIGAFVMANPWVIVIMAIVAALAVLYLNWDKVKEKISEFWAWTDKIADGAKRMGRGFVEMIKDFKDILENSLKLLMNFFISYWLRIGNFISNLNIFEGLYNALTVKIPAFLRGLLPIAKEVFNSIIGYINGIKLKAPEWVPMLGGKEFSFNIPKLYTGAEYWQGGAAMIHDQGAEIVDLPNGSRIIPHDRSLKIAESNGANKVVKGDTFNINISKFSDSIVVREEADIDRIAEAFVKKLKIQGINRMKGAIA